MKMHIEEHELIQAVLNYVEYRGIPLSGQQCEVKLVAGRGTNGHYADVIIIDPNEPPPIANAATATATAETSSPFTPDPEETEATGGSDSPEAEEDSSNENTQAIDLPPFAPDESESE